MSNTDLSYAESNVNTMPTCDIYLRLSDPASEESFDGREAKLRAEASKLAWIVHRVIIENDLDETGKPKLASAFKRRMIRLPGSDRPVLRVIRPGFRSLLDDLASGRANAALVEDLDRLLRQPRDGEDLLDTVEMSGATCRSLSGSLKLTDGGTEDERFMCRIMAATAAKASADTARRVADAKARLHGASYSGGNRPYGYCSAQDTERYHRNLIMVPDEADVIREAATAILDHNVSLKAVARDLNDRGVPAATGAKWSAAAVRYVLVKPSIAGLQQHLTEKDRRAARTRGGKPPQPTLKDAPWDAILDRDVWERLCDKLNNPERLTNGGPGREPRWLLSNIATCGICGGITEVSGSYASYVCKGPTQHLRRSAKNVDRAISGLIVARLSQPDITDLLKPPPSIPVADAKRLRGEARKLRDRKASQMKMHAAGLIDDNDLLVGLREIKERLAVIDAQLATSDKPDPLAEFRDKPAEVVWESLSLARRREVVKLLVRVEFLPVKRRGPGFDPESVAVDWVV